MLTASETAPRYPIETMRLILTLVIVASFLLSALNILLRPSKRLGLTGLLFCMAGVLAGGSTVEVGSGTAAFRVACFRRMRSRAHFVRVGPPTEPTS